LNEWARRFDWRWYPPLRLRRQHAARVLLSEPVRDKVRAASKRPDRRAQVSAAKKGKPRPPHVQELLRMLRVGRKHTEETRAKMREAARRRRDG